jgi:lysophospholipase L1-like esterase
MTTAFMHLLNFRWIMVFSVLMMAAMSLSSASESKKPRVITFGDSTTAQRGTVTVYTTQLEGKFPDVEFLNKGVGGHDTNMAANRFAADVLANRPDVVIIQFGINDAAVDLWKTPPATESRVSLDGYEKNLRSFVAQLREIGAKVIFMTPNQVRWSPHTLEMYGRPPYDPEDPQGFTRILEKYAERMREVAKDLQVPLVDIYALYDAEDLKQAPCRDLLPDGMHPSEKGHALVAEKILPVLQSALGHPAPQAP